MVRSDRHTARLQALEILYQREITGEGVAEILEEHTYSTENGEPDEFCKSLALGVEANLQRIDETIGTTSEHWTVSRMPMVDRSILRVATYELLYSEDTPASVAINEAVELAKTFGGEDSSKFVNGVLGKIAEQYRSGE